MYSDGQLKPLIIALSGPSCAGKTTLAERINIPTVSPDHYRQGHHKKASRIAFNQAYDEAERLLKLNQAIVFDSCSVTGKARESLRRFAKRLNTPIQFFYLVTPLEELLKRNQMRSDRHTPERIIRSMYRDHAISCTYVMNDPDFGGFISDGWGMTPQSALFGCRPPIS